MSKKGFAKRLGEDARAGFEREPCGLFDLDRDEEVFDAAAFALDEPVRPAAVRTISDPSLQKRDARHPCSVQRFLRKD